jgi:hypothetical protein
MTLARPYLYWQRHNSYNNNFSYPNTHVYNRNTASRSVQDLHVRSYLHTRVTITTTTTTPPPVDWFAGLDFIQVAQWTPQPGSSISDAGEGDQDMMCYEPLVLVHRSTIAAPGRDVAQWSTLRVASAKVYHAAPADNFDFPAVQAGLYVVDLGGVRDPTAGYIYTLTIHHALETLWASTVPPG